MKEPSEIALRALSVKIDGDVGEGCCHPGLLLSCASDVVGKTPKRLLVGTVVCDGLPGAALTASDVLAWTHTPES